MSGRPVVAEYAPFSAGTLASVAYTRAAINNMPTLEFSTPATGVSEYQWLQNNTPIAYSNYASIQPNANAGEASLTFTAQVKDACGATPDAWINVPGGAVTLGLVRPACNCEPSTVTFTGVTFISSTETTMGAQVWSDYAKADNCNENMFAGGSPESPGRALCRTSFSSVGSSLFSWCVVGLFGDQLCPTGWHIPTEAEMLDLDKIVTNNRVTDGAQRTISDSNFNTDMNKYRNDWGAKQAHMCHDKGLDDTYYLGDMFWTATKGKILQLTTGPDDGNKLINPKKTRDSGNGLSVRCIRN
jgi:uncharacterized protein (TIGR02145 family)